MPLHRPKPCRTTDELLTQELFVLVPLRPGNQNSWNQNRLLQMKWSCSCPKQCNWAIVDAWPIEPVPQRPRFQMSKHFTVILTRWHRQKVHTATRTSSYPSTSCCSKHVISSRCQSDSKWAEQPASIPNERHLNSESGHPGWVTFQPKYLKDYVI